MEFYKNFQELIDSKILSQKGLDELKMNLEFDGFDIEHDDVELRSFKDNYEVINWFSPNLFNALKKEQAFCCFDDEAYFQQLQANDGFFSYVIENIIFIV